MRNHCIIATFKIYDAQFFEKEMTNNVRYTFSVNYNIRVVSN